jgi:hypothetical protein
MPVCTYYEKETKESDFKIICQLWMNAGYNSHSLSMMTFSFLWATAVVAEIKAEHLPLFSHAQFHRSSLRYELLRMNAPLSN